MNSSVRYDRNFKAINRHAKSN